MQKAMTADRKVVREAVMYSPDPEKGLSASQIKSRIADGLTNKVTVTPTRTTWQILRANLFTLFNLINVCLAIALIIVGSYRNTLFMGVIVFNTLIGVYQETKSKRAVEKLSLIAQPVAQVVRDGVQETVPTDDVVLEDVLIYRPGMQICADCEVLTGEIEANESLLTGERDPVVKRTGDNLRSGSFVVSGVCRAKAMAVGDESYAAKLAASARVFKQPTSEIMTSLNRIVKAIGIAIVPVGIALFLRQRGAGLTTASAITGSAAAMIGMIPQGLVLLTSVALAVGAFNLAKQNVLIRQLCAIESLARVDVLCLDKTGTITTGEISVSDDVVFDGTREELTNAIRAIVKSTKADNATSHALREKYGDEYDGEIVKSQAFSSERKWSAALISGGVTVYAGAPERLLPSRLLDNVNKYASEGMRVIAVSQSQTGQIPDKADQELLKPLGIVLMSDTIRPHASETLDYFASQGVDIKIISGDSPVTVSAVAQRAGVKNAERYVDMSTLKDEQAVYEASEKYTVFSRVTPAQKMWLVKALKKQNHVVGMTGDGVNDVLALKESDCSIAMASGSDAARQVANVTLMDDNFENMPNVVFEGRRVTNNVQNAASLFLTKTIFSMALALFTLAVGTGYPFEPIQLTLFSTLFIGYPSFVLALQPNSKRIQGDFMKNVLSHALPSGLGIAFGIYAILAVCAMNGESAGATGTMALILTSAVGLVALIGVCQPFNALRAVLVASSVIAFLLCVVFLKELYSLEVLNLSQGAVILGGVAFALGVMKVCDYIIKKRGWKNSV